MDIDDKRLLLREQLDQFRHWSYDELACEINRTSRKHDCLRCVVGVFSDGTEYQMEFTVCWDGRKDGAIRVMGDLTAAPQRPLFGFLPIFSSDVTDDHIMRRDGTFVGE